MAELECGLGGIEVVGLRVEVLDRLGHDAGAGRNDEPVVGETLAVQVEDRLRRLVDPLHLADYETHSGVEQAPLGALEMLGSLAAHRDVHEARLVGVDAGRVDDRERHLAGLERRGGAA